MPHSRLDIKQIKESSGPTMVSLLDIEVYGRLVFDETGVPKAGEDFQVPVTILPFWSVDPKILPPPLFSLSSVILLFPSLPECFPIFPPPTTPGFCAAT